MISPEDIKLRRIVRPGFGVTYVAEIPMRGFATHVDEYAARSMSAALRIDELAKENVQRGVMHSVYGFLTQPTRKLQHIALRNCGPSFSSLEEVDEINRLSAEILFPLNSVK